MRVAVLGGSSVSSVQFARAIGRWPGGGARRPRLEIALHGRDEAKLAAVAAAFARAAPAVEVFRSLVLTEVLNGADVVLVQVRVGGLAARALDESFPWQAGLPGEETLGPGGFASALRTLRALDGVWPEIRRACPHALVLVLTNPAGIVTGAATGHGLRAVAVCDSPAALVSTVADRLGADPSQVARRYAGLNHVGWYVAASDDELAALSSRQAIGADVVRAHQAVPLGYLRYYVDPGRVYAGQLGKPTRAEQLIAIEAAALDRLAHGESPDPLARPAPWYDLAVLPVLDGVANGSPQPLIVGSANNGRLPALPADATVEGPALIAAGGVVEPLDVVALPPLPAALLYRHATYEQLAIEAAGDPNRDRLLRAMLANPMVATAEQAELLTDALLARLAREAPAARAEARPA